MLGHPIAWAFGAARDGLARALIRAGVTPNALSVFGLVMTLAAAAALALGAGAGFAWTLDPGPLTTYAANVYALLAGILLIFCAAGDMLDGAVARLGGKGTTFGAFLDSTLDRFSDFAIYLGIAFYFAARGNLTGALLPFLALFAAQMISYTRARAEDLIDFCTVGYWQRGERFAAIMIAAFAGNIPALLWQQAFLPLLTVWARIRYTREVAAGRAPLLDPRRSGRALDRLRLWRHPRGTIPYELVTAANIAWLVFARIPADADPLRGLLGLG